MATNAFIAVPVPAGNGVGAPVSVSGLGLKTFIIGGNLSTATVQIEGGILGRFAPLFRVDQPNNFRNVRFPLDQVRVRLSGLAPATCCGNHESAASRRGEGESSCGVASIVSDSGKTGWYVPVHSSRFRIRSSYRRLDLQRALPHQLTIR